MKQTTTVHLRISENLKQKFQNFCQENDTTLSEEIKKMIEKKLKNNGIKI